MSEEVKGYFKVLKRTKLSDLETVAESEFDKVELCESDITIQTDTHLIQYEYVDPEDNVKKTVIKPGVFSFVETNIGLQLQKFELRKYDLLESIDNTKSILDEANKFFGRLEVYDKLKREPKRALLLASVPGVGKTAAINKVCEKLLLEEGTTVIVWDTSQVRSSMVSNFFLNHSSFDEKVNRLVVVMEDIGGGSMDDYHGPKGADSSLLNLLDGVGSPFKGVPTFIIATTNNPENSVEALIDRPGRFDKVEILKTPNTEETAKLLKFIVKDYHGDLSEEELKEIAKKASKNEFSIAHLQEIVVRSLLDDISMLEATNQLIEHKKRFQNAFNDPRKPMGLRD